MAPDKLDVLSGDDRAGATSFGRNRGSWTTHFPSWAVGLGLTLSIRRRVVPLLARREAGHYLAILVHLEVTKSVVLIGGAGGQRKPASGLDTSSTL